MVDTKETKFGYMPKFWKNSISLNTLVPMLVGVRITPWQFSRDNSNSTVRRSCYTEKKRLVYSHQLVKITHFALSIIQFKFGELSNSILRYSQ